MSRSLVMCHRSNVGSALRKAAVTVTVTQCNKVREQLSEVQEGECEVVARQLQEVLERRFVQFRLQFRPNHCGVRMLTILNICCDFCYISVDIIFRKRRQGRRRRRGRGRIRRNSETDASLQLHVPFRTHQSVTNFTSHVHVPNPCVYGGGYH